MYISAHIYECKYTNRHTWICIRTWVYVLWLEISSTHIERVQLLWRRFVWRFKKRYAITHLNIFCLNIRSLPWHAGEIVVFLKLLQTNFDVIVLTEIGARNITTVEHLFDDYQFMYTLPKTNMYGGVGLYLSNAIINVNILTIHIYVNHVIVQSVILNQYL